MKLSQEINKESKSWAYCLRLDQTIPEVRLTLYFSITQANEFSVLLKPVWFLICTKIYT